MIVMEIEEVFDETEEIIVYNDGTKTSYGSGDDNFGTIMSSWKELLCGAHQMPAYGVSLNKETVKAMKSGLWTEFVFDGERKSNGMPFEKLLVNVVPDYYGFNLIRYNSEYGYDGRCFYVDLVNKDMSKFYNVLVNL